MEFSEFKQRQAWSLNQKIDHSVGTIEAFINGTGQVPFVSFSGGKDSTVLLDIARRYVDRDMKAVFCNTGNEFPEIVRFVRSVDNVTVIRPELTIKEVLAKYGFPLISKEQALGIRQLKTTKSERLRSIRLHGSNPQNGWRSGKVSDKWHYLEHEPFMISEKCCDCLKKRPMAKYLRQSGELPIIGTMATESLLRQQMYLRRGGCNSFNGNKSASYPLSIWTDQDIWGYIRMQGIPYCELYDKGHQRTGCMVCGFGAHLEKDFSRFEVLYRLHPKAYRIFMDYTNNGVTYRQALRTIGVKLPDEP